MTRSFFGASLLALTLAACGGGDDTADIPEAPEAEAPAPQEITITEPEAAEPIELTSVLGTFEGEVTGLSFSRNAARVQESTLLAANGPAGVALIPTTEGGTPGVYALPGRRAAAVAATAIGENPLVAIASTSPAGDAVIELASFSADRTELISFASVGGGFDSAPTELCFAGDMLAGITANGSVVQFSIGLVADTAQISVSDVETGATAHCASLGDRVLLLGRDGQLRELSEGGTVIDTGATKAPANVVDMAAMPFSEGEAVFFVLEDGQVVTGDRVFSFSVGGEPVGAMRLGAGAENFGGINRNGVMAVLTDENTLGLVSWLSVANALELDRETNERIAFPALPEAPELDIQTPDLDLPDLPAAPAEGQ